MRKCSQCRYIIFQKCGSVQLSFDLNQTAMLRGHDLWLCNQLQA